MNKPLTRQLGIDEALLDLGLVTEAQLRDFNQLERADEYLQHTEHYRYMLYCEFLERTSTISDGTFKALMGILWDDGDRVMANATLLNLSRHKGITTTQLGTIRTVAPRCIRKSIP